MLTVKYIILPLFSARKISWVSYGKRERGRKQKRGAYSKISSLSDYSGPPSPGGAPGGKFKERNQKSREKREGEGGKGWRYDIPFILTRR